MPRLVSPDWYFARAHSGNARQRAWGGLNRLWTLAKVLRGLENKLEHLDFDADDTDALREMAGLIALLHRQNQTLPIEGDAYGRELELWRAAYADELERLNAFDTEAAPALFPVAAQANRAFEWPQTLVADDLGQPSPALEIGLSSLIERAHIVAATLVVPGADDEISGRARAFWTRHGARFLEAHPPLSPRLSTARALLEPTAAPPPTPPSDVSLWTAHTASDEAARLAGHIRREVESGAHAGEFCLVVPDKGAQEPTLRAAFAAAGVPLDWPSEEVANSPLIERIMRLLVPRSSRSVDELHDLFGDGSLRLEWESAIPEKSSRLDAGRLRRAHRSIRGEDPDSAWRDPAALARDWEARIARLRAVGAGRGDDAKAELLARSLDGGDLDGICRLKELLAPFSNSLSAREWANAVREVVDALTAHWEESTPQFSGEGEAIWSSARPEESFARPENSSPLEAHESHEVAARAALSAFRAALGAVAGRAGDDESARPAGAWTAWLRLELFQGEAKGEESHGETQIAGVRVLGLGDESEAPRENSRGVFVVGLTENAWPRPRPNSSWPRATARSLETLRADEAPPLSLALHGFARLLACPVPLSLSRPSWTRGVESGASPLWEDLSALFPDATWPALSPADSGGAPATRADWLRQLARAQNGAQGEETALDGPLQIRLLALDAMRRERAAPDGLGRYDGVLGEGSHAMLQTVLPRDDGRLVVSASALELYARCPIRFFFERVLLLPDESAAEDDLSRAESGDLVHRILHGFRRDWHGVLNSASFEDAREFLARITRRECDALGLPPILRRAEAHRLIGSPERAGVLLRLLRAECREADAHPDTPENALWNRALHPLVHLAGGRIEADFAGDFALSHIGNGLEQGFRLPLQGALVQGRIDRMDAASDGSLLVVLDYKTGGAASLPSFVKGSDRIHFQLAVYVLAAHELTRDWNPSPRVAGVFLSPRAGFSGWTAPPEVLGQNAKSSMSEGVLAQWLGDSRAQIERIAALIEAGTFNLSLRTAPVARCENCASRALCGQNPARQAARAEVFLESDEVFLPERIEWA